MIRISKAAGFVNQKSAFSWKKSFSLPGGRRKRKTGPVPLFHGRKTWYIDILEEKLLQEVAP
jgi:hypothetical protein